MRRPFFFLGLTDGDAVARMLKDRLAAVEIISSAFFTGDFGGSLGNGVPLVKMGGGVRGGGTISCLEAGRSASKLPKTGGGVRGGETVSRLELGRLLASELQLARVDVLKNAFGNGLCFEYGVGDGGREISSSDCVGV